MSESKIKLDSFNLAPGRIMASRYRVEALLGKGWEGEVYRVKELGTGIDRAVKLFYPDRNPGNQRIIFYAQKLNKLHECPILIQYYGQDKFDFRDHEITFLISEYVPGDLLPVFIKKQPKHRLHYYEALHLLHKLAKGLEEVHALKEYHGDLHSENVLIQRTGLNFKIKLVDMYYHGRYTSNHVFDDVCSAIRVFYDCVGGQKHYAKHPAYVKKICCGLKRGLIMERYPTMRKLITHIESMKWD